MNAPFMINPATHDVLLAIAAGELKAPKMTPDEAKTWLDNCDVVPFIPEPPEDSATITFRHGKD